MSSTLLETPPGLTSAEVAKRVADGRMNAAADSPVYSLGQIIRANILSPVNAIMIVLFILIMVAQSPGDALFVGVVISNSIIGIVQELRAKKELEKLAVLNAPVAKVIRNSEQIEIQVEKVVADDVVALNPGDQVVVDGEVISSLGLELDESLLTGESIPIEKDAGNEVLSGSFVSAGSGFFRATHVGSESYASKLSTEAKHYSPVRSELRSGINWVLKVLIIIIPIATLLLLFTQLDIEDEWRDALISVVASAVAMVPDGLVLLTSLSFLAGVIILARKKTLAKELATVELLARVDVLCLDKTGTITTGAICFGGIDYISEHPTKFIHEALGAFAASDPSPNATMLAVKNNFEAPGDWEAVNAEPFSSDKKWSGVQFKDKGTFYFGAPDVLLKKGSPELEKVSEHAVQAKRVLVLCASKEGFLDNGLPPDLQPLVLILLEDEIRPDAEEIFGFFAKRGVILKVISGDTIDTVSVVASRAGIENALVNPMDARELPDDQSPGFADAIEQTTVFGRVTPRQKRSMVNALKSRGHTVAMTGDGVNDVLALKDADMSIAMGSGSAATRAVAQLVLLDNRFSTLPKVLNESRKVINNIERVANLFVAKAVYAILLTFLAGLLSDNFPFLPRHLTLIGTFSIGLPGIFLALAPSSQKVGKGFIKRVLYFSIPAGFLAALGTEIVYKVALSQSENVLSLDQARSVATITLLAIGLFILAVTARPLVLWKLGLVAGMGVLYTLILVIPFGQEYFEFNLPWDGVQWIWLWVGGAVLVCGMLVALIPKIIPGLTTEEDTN